MLVLVKQSDFHYLFVLSHERLRNNSPCSKRCFLVLWSILTTRSANSEQLKPETQWKQTCLLAKIAPLVCRTLDASNQK